MADSRASASSPALLPLRIPATLVRADSDWAGEGHENGTVPLDIGVGLRFDRAHSSGDDAEEDGDGDGDASGLELIARNRRGVDLSGMEGQQIEGRLEIDVAALLDSGVSAEEEEEEAEGDHSSLWLFSWEQNDTPDSASRFETTLRGRVAAETEVVHQMVFRMTLETPFGLVVADGHLPHAVRSRRSGREEDLQAEHFAVGQWVTVRGFPCFDIEKDWSAPKSCHR